MKHCFPAILMAALLLSCTDEKLENVAPDKPEVETADGSEIVSGQAYVRFSDEMTIQIEAAQESGTVKTKSAALNNTLESFGISSMRRVFSHGGEMEPAMRREGLHRWYVIEYSTDIPYTKAAGAFRGIEGVEYIESVPQIKRNDTFNDLTKELWGLNNIDKPGFDINVQPVWEQYTTGDPKVIVAVVDGGVDLRHEDLAANCLPSSQHYNAVRQNNVITADEHGTHVAGTIAAVSNNGIGIAGIAGGDHAKGKAGVSIMACQIFDGNGSNSPDAIKWAANNGAVICQNSWGYNYDTNNDGEFSREELENNRKTQIREVDKVAVDYFIKYAGCDAAGNQRKDSPMKGGLVVFAAGNDALTNGAPANYEPVIAVGSIAPDGKRSSFSNYGDWVDIAAPGTAILSTVPGHSYKELQGTSMACPHVSAVAALLVSHYGGPGFDCEMLKERLLGSANTSVLSSAYRIGGLLDAYGAFVYGKQVDVDPVVEMTADGRSNNVDFTMKAPLDSEGAPAYGYMVLYGKNEADVAEATPTSHDKVEFATCTPGTEAGEMFSYTMKGLDFNSTYYLKVYAYSYSRCYSEPTYIMKIETTGNNAPEITVEYDGGMEFKAAAEVNIPVMVTEPDGHGYEVTYESGSAADVLKATVDGNWQIVINAKEADAGTYKAKVTAEDEYGLKFTKEVTYTILVNHAPEKIKEIDNIMLTAKGIEFRIDMSEYAKDSDEEELKYEISYIKSNGKEEVSSNVLHVIVKNGSLIGTSLGYGIETVSVKAKDAKGDIAVFNFKVQVKNPAEPLTVYPNPVTDFVSIGTLDAAETYIRIVSQTGKTVYEETLTVSGYEPAMIDMTSCPPGIYVALVSFGGEEFKQNIVKL